jgi:HAMP domain-containing protein
MSDVIRVGGVYATTEDYDVRITIPTQHSTTVLTAKEVEELANALKKHVAKLKRRKRK